MWANEDETQRIRLSAVVVLIAVTIDNESWLTVRKLISNILHAAVLTERRNKTYIKLK